MKSIDPMMVRHLLICAVFIVLAFFANGILRSIRQRGIIVSGLSRLYPVIEMLAAVAILYSAAFTLLRDRSSNFVILFTVISAITLFAGRFLLHDYLAGVFLNTEHFYRLGEKVGMDGTNGKIAGIGPFALLIEDEEGVKIRMTYSSIFTNSSFRCYDSAAHRRRHSWTCKITEDKGLHAMREDLRRRILNCPWTITTSEPDIKVIEERADEYLIEVTAELIDGSFAPLARESLAASTPVADA